MWQQKCVNWPCCCCRIGGSYAVTTVKQCSSACSQQQAAEDFLRSRLYGPGSRRSTCKEQPNIPAALTAAASLRFKPAFAFHTSRQPAAVPAEQERPGEKRSRAVCEERLGWVPERTETRDHLQPFSLSGSTDQFSRIRRRSKHEPLFQKSL